MPSSKNRVVIASAGGRKTTYIIEEALKKTEEKILITTYTLENLDQINSYLIEQNGHVPKNITALSWFTFLLRDGVRPYQNYMLANKKVRSVDFQSRPSIYIKKSEQAYFINSASNIYRDRVSDFVCEGNKVTTGLIIKRLEKVFDYIYVDEIQDLAGWDQEFVELLLLSSIKITLVGDPRQATYTTNNANKNKATKGKHMKQWVDELSKKGILDIEERVECFRSNQDICNFADRLFPQLPKSVSKNDARTGHDGIFFIKPKELPSYFAKYKPKILRWDRRSDTLDFPAMNIGLSKGRTFERVVIFPTNPMKEYLRTKDIEKAGDISKLYVAITRAKHSVAFVIG